jgi:hypothetical protein
MSWDGASGTTWPTVMRLYNATRLRIDCPMAREKAEAFGESLRDYAARIAPDPVAHTRTERNLGSNVIRRGFFVPQNPHHRPRGKPQCCGPARYFTQEGSGPLRGKRRTLSSPSQG